MNYLTVSLLAIAGLLSGCVANLPAISPMAKVELCKFLDVRFASASVPKDREEDFYRALEVYAKLRPADEFVWSVRFAANDLVEFSFVDADRRSYGTDIFKKKNKRWVFDERHFHAGDPFSISQKPSRSP